MDIYIYIYITLYKQYLTWCVPKTHQFTGMSHWSAACRVVAQLFLSQVPVSSHISELSTWRRKHEFLIVAAWRFGMIWPYFWLRYKMSQYVASSVLVLLCLISMHHLSQTHFGHRFQLRPAVSRAGPRKHWLAARGHDSDLRTKLGKTKGGEVSLLSWVWKWHMDR